MDAINIKPKACCGSAVELRGTRRCQSSLRVGEGWRTSFKHLKSLSSTTQIVNKSYPLGVTGAVACTTPVTPAKAQARQSEVKVRSGLSCSLGSTTLMDHVY